MNFTRIHEAQKYSHNTKWVFLFEDANTQDFFVDYLWDAIEKDSGFLHDLLVWSNGTKEGFQNAITKVGGSKNGKNVLLYREEAYRPRVGKRFNVGVDNGGMKDFVRGLIESGKFDDAIAAKEGTETYSKDGAFSATIKSGLIGTPVSGKKIVTNLVVRLLSMFIGPRMPGDEREQSAFYVGQDTDDGELSNDSSIAAAIELLKKQGYTVTKDPLIS